MGTNRRFRWSLWRHWARQPWPTPSIEQLAPHLRYQIVISSPRPHLILLARPLAAQESSFSPADAVPNCDSNSAGQRCAQGPSPLPKTCPRLSVKVVGPRSRNALAQSARTELLVAHRSDREWRANDAEGSEHRDTGAFQLHSNSGCGSLVYARNIARSRETPRPGDEGICRQPSSSSTNFGLAIRST